MAMDLTELVLACIKEDGEERIQKNGHEYCPYKEEYCPYRNTGRSIKIGKTTNFECVFQNYFGIFGREED
jgi:hypothetical protein